VLLVTIIAIVYLLVPEKYEGGREELKTFLTDIELFYRFNIAYFYID